jgi:PilZ domain
MESQLVAGQWVEVSMEDLQHPVLLSGFVLSLRPSEVLLTFPELLSPPKGLESEAQATVRYSNQSGQFTAVGNILRVAAGPPVTVTFKRLAPLGADPRRIPIRTAARLPVSVRVVTSSVASSLGQEDMPGWTENLSASGMLLGTSLLLAIGDVLRLAVSHGAECTVMHGRVIRVHESEDRAQSQFGVGVELVHGSEVERQRWLVFLARLQGQQRR